MAMRCRICAASGVDGPAMPGEQVCAAHAAMAAAVPPGLAGVADPAASNASLTQSTAGLSIGDSDIDVDDAGDAGDAVHRAAPLAASPAARTVFTELIEHQVMPHLEIINARAALGNFPVVPSEMKTRSDFQGPDLELGTLESRVRFAKLIGSTIDTATWSTTDTQEARNDVAGITQVADQCVLSMDSWKAERKKLRASKLPLWMELGTQALDLLRRTAPHQSDILLTQWSNIFATPAAGVCCLGEERAIRGRD
ncbi:unnamed protein product, partial [Prorocentrum cordatum]